MTEVQIFEQQLVPLTTKEAALRKALEGRLFEKVQYFYLEVGEILTEIRDKRLYKSTHIKFSDYSQDVLDMVRRDVDRHIQAVAVVKNLLPADCQNETNWSHGISQHPEIIIPQNESQARALVDLEPDEQRRVWQEAVGSAPEGRITAAHVRKTRRDLGMAEITDKISLAKRPKKQNGSRITDEFQAAFSVFLAAVQLEIDTNWKGTDRLTVLRHLDGIRVAISANGNHRVPDEGYAPELSNVEKLLSAGLDIYRMNDQHLLIEQQLQNGDWVVVRDGFETLAELQATFIRMMEVPTNIRG